MGCTTSSVPKPTSKKNQYAKNHHKFNPSSVPAFFTNKTVQKPEQAIQLLQELSATNRSNPTWNASVPKALDEYQIQHAPMKYKNSGMNYFSEDDYVELRNLFDVPAGLVYFKKYIETLPKNGPNQVDFQEVLRGWLGFHEYHQLENESNIRIAAEVLFKNFILENAPKFQNLPEAVKLAISKCREEVTNTLYPNFTPDQSAFVHEGNNLDGINMNNNNGGNSSELSSSTGVVSTAVVPPPTLFLNIQSSLFQSMRPLLAGFKESIYHEEFLRERNQNKVEPDDFLYLNLLGCGGFGQVVHVIKKSTNKHYAMKMQAKTALLDTWGDKLELVKIERDVLVASEGFPFIVDLHYAFQSKSHAFLVLDLAECGSLFSLLEKNRVIDESQLRLYVAEIVSALEVLHSHFIIHRDIKAANVLLKQDGHVVLADLGLAGFYYANSKSTENVAVAASTAVRNLVNEANSSNKNNQDTKFSNETANDQSTNDITAIEEDSEIPRPLSPENCESGNLLNGNGVTHDQRVIFQSTLGTVLHRPPEVIQGKPYGLSVDYYMLGVLIFECLTGALPCLPTKVRIYEKKAQNGNNDPAIDKPVIDDDDELRAIERGFEYPAFLSQRVKLLLPKLLNPVAEERLGSKVNDIEVLKGDPFFWNLEGPFAEKIDWLKVLNKQYPPVFVPEEVKLGSKPVYKNFDHLQKCLIKNAQAEAKKLAKATTKDPKQIQKLVGEAKEFFTGKEVEPCLEKYFADWNFIDSDTIALEIQSSETENLTLLHTGSSILNRLGGS